MLFINSLSHSTWCYRKICSKDTAIGFPRTRAELGELLRKASLLVSLDPISNITYEATLCGTAAIIVNDIFEFSSRKFNIDLHGIFNDPNLYAKAVQNAALAFNDYEVIIKENEKNVKKF